MSKIVIDTDAKQIVKFSDNDTTATLSAWAESALPLSHNFYVCELKGSQLSCFSNEDLKSICENTFNIDAGDDVLDYAAKIKYIVDHSNEIKDEATNMAAPSKKRATKKRATKKASSAKEVAAKEIADEPKEVTPSSASARKKASKKKASKKKVAKKKTATKKTATKKAATKKSPVKKAATKKTATKKTATKKTQAKAAGSDYTEERNGVKPAKPGTNKALIWGTCDKLAKKLKAKPAVADVVAACEEQGIKASTASACYRGWCRYHS